MLKGVVSTIIGCSHSRRTSSNAVCSPTSVIRFNTAFRSSRLLQKTKCTRLYSVPNIDRSTHHDLSVPAPLPDEDPQTTIRAQSVGYQEGARPESSTPWYLQVETPLRAKPPLLERQKLPALPPDPPPLLKAMLEHISVDLGLDDLTLFDLRDIDPPPALGANLLMILGTARSEKHLHVSADRFCKWLKSTHKLKPYADGLLGRGELKLKLRRKARRAKLLSGVGSSDTRNIDDGIRTGWICVNVGIIPDGTHERGTELELSGIVGFSDQADGAKVVIQMLTEGKREELDLEDLWGKMLRRQERKVERLAET